MNNLYVGRRAAALAVVAALGFITGPTALPEPIEPSLMVHGPIDVHRRDDGSLKRGPRNEIDTSNWSGYAIASFETGQKYTSAQATWTVPSVSFGATQSSTSEEYSSTWVGIGGFCLNVLCTRADRTLIQLGTEQDVSSSGSTNYLAWYEMLPQYPVTIPVAIHPGDQVTASLHCVSACSNKKQNWLLSMTNQTTGNSWSGNFTYSSSLASAVWIEEAPYSSGVLPLADFNIVGLDYPSANGVSQSLTVAANGIQMTDPWGQTANPSDTDLFGFDVCWGYTSMTSCSPP